MNRRQFLGVGIGAVQVVGSASILAYGAREVFSSTLDSEKEIAAKYDVGIPAAREIRETHLAVGSLASFFTTIVVLGGYKIFDKTSPEAPKQKPAGMSPESSL